MKWPTLGVAAAVILVAPLAACGSSTENNPLASDSPTTADSPAAPTTSSGTTPAAPAEVSGQITLYTSQPDTDVAAMVEAFNKEHAGVKVNVFRSGTEEVISKLQAEKQAGTSAADVIFIADALSMEKLKSEQLLAEYSSPEAAGIPAELVDADKFYTGTKIITTGIVINTDKVKTDPTSWNIFTSPEAKGVAEMPSPLYSGAAAYNVALFANDPAFGWDYWEKLAANGMTVTKGNGAVLKDVASGAKSYGMVVEFIVARAAAEGSPVKFIYPEEGVPAITEPIALAAGGKNPDAAKAFIDFVLSESGQEVASGLGYVPIRSGAPVPNGLKGIDEVKVMTGDLTKLIAEVDPAKEKFKTTFKQ